MTGRYLAYLSRIKVTFLVTRKGIVVTILSPPGDTCSM